MEVERVGALGSWGSGMGRGYGNARGGVRGTEGGGETDGPGEVGGRFLIVLTLGACYPSGLCGEDWGLAEAQYSGGGCSSPGHCLCGGERCPWDSFQGIWEVGAVGRRVLSRRYVLGGEPQVYLRSLGWVGGTLPF